MPWESWGREAARLGGLGHLQSPGVGSARAGGQEAVRGSTGAARGLHQLCDPLKALARSPAGLGMGAEGQVGEAPELHQHPSETSGCSTHHGPAQGRAGPDAQRPSASADRSPRLCGSCSVVYKSTGGPLRVDRPASKNGARSPGRGGSAVVRSRLLVWACGGAGGVTAEVGARVDPPDRKQLRRSGPWTRGPAEAPHRLQVALCPRVARVAALTLLFLSRRDPRNLRLIQGSGVLS
uniref:Uncharacterized protein n=1 Tax=Rangifer tarandus platyrhynchus TaxID=3082113 RepID=A0ACB0DZA1_RANTA|nr:unnamed protein product [Rangifer tarandus platyrhynchus]